MSTTLPSIASQLETDRRDVLAACSGDGSFLMIGENAASPRLQLPQPPLYDRLANDSGVVVLDKPIILGDAWTIESWFKYPLPDQNGWNTLVRGRSFFHILVRHSDKQLGCYVSSNGKLDGFKASGLNLKNLTPGWHHIAAVRSETHIKYYVDAKIKGQVDCSTFTSYSKEPIKWLGNTGTDSGAYSQSFGAIRNFSVWNKSLTDADLTTRLAVVPKRAVVNPRAPKVSTSDLVAKYALDDLDDHAHSTVDKTRPGRVTWKPKAAPTGMSVGGVECKIGIALPSTQSGDFTVESWTVVPAAAQARIITLGVASEGLAYVKFTAEAGKNSLSLCARTKESSRIPLGAGATYVHLAISCGTRAGTTTWTLYVDGVSAGSIQTTEAIPRAGQSLYFGCHVPALANLRLWSQVLDAAGVLFRRSLGVIPPSLTGLVGRLVAPDEHEEALPKSVVALAAKTSVTTRKNWPVTPSLTPSGSDATITAGLASRITAAVGYVRQQKQLMDAATTRSSLDAALKLVALSLGGGGIGATLANSEGLPQLDLNGTAQQLTLTLSNNGKSPLWLSPGAEAIRLSFPPGMLDTTTLPTANDFTVTVSSPANGPISFILQSKPNRPATAVNALVIPISGLKPLGETRICQVAVSCTVADASGKVAKSVRTVQLGMSRPSGASVFTDENFSARFVSDARIALSGGIPSDLVIEFKGTEITAVELDLRTADWGIPSGWTYSTGEPPAANSKANPTDIPTDGIISLTQSNVSSVKLTLTGLVSSLTSPSAVRFKAKILAADNKEYVFWLAVECRSYVDKGAEGIVFDETVKTKVIQDSSATPKWKLDTEGTLSANSAVITTDVRFNTLNKNQNAKKLVVDETTLRVEGETILNGVLSAFAINSTTRAQQPNPVERFYAEHLRQGRYLICEPQLLSTQWTAEASFQWPLPPTTEIDKPCYRSMFNNTSSQHHLLFRKKSATDPWELGAYFNNDFQPAYKLPDKFSQGYHRASVVCQNQKWSYYLDGKEVGSVDNPPSAESISVIGGHLSAPQSIGPLTEIRIWRNRAQIPETAIQADNQPDLEIVDGVPCPAGVSYGSKPSAPAIPRPVDRLLPDGTIIMWNGTISDIPVDWYLCDGRTLTLANDSTIQLPDLRDKMIRSGATAGKTGGHDYVTLTVDNLPPHSHEVNDPGHQHALHRFTDDNAKAIGVWPSLAIGSGNKIASIDSNSQVTGISLDPAGYGIPISIIPAYYQLAFLAFYPDVKLVSAPPIAANPPMEYREINGAKYRFDPANQTLFLKQGSRPDQQITDPNLLVSKDVLSKGTAITAEHYNMP